MSGSRLLLEIGYALLPIYAMDYSPVVLARSQFNLDRYINRPIIKLQAVVNEIRYGFEAA